MKIFFRIIHLYLGLGAGLVIMMTCFTGAILVFETELQQLFNKHRYFVAAVGNHLSADSLIQSVRVAQPLAKVSGIKIYADQQRSAEVFLSFPAAKKITAQKKMPEQGAKAKAPEANRIIAFVNPYSGKLIELYNHKASFFYEVMDLHRWMLGGEVGKLVVGTCTLIFLFILITGIILWWPKNKIILQQRLKIKTGAGFKRLNHDYHLVFGFYSAIFLFVFAFTGLAWSFEWFNKGIYTLTGTTMQRPKMPKMIAGTSTQKISAEAVLQTVLANNSQAMYYNINLPKDSTEVNTVTVLPKNAAHETATTTYYVDVFSPIIISRQSFAERNLGQKVRASFRPIHVAAIYGLPSKIIGLLACLLGTFFPASGIIMWLNRTRKKNKTSTAAIEAG